MNFLAKVDPALMFTRDVTIGKTARMDLMKMNVHYYRYLNHMIRHYLLNLEMILIFQMIFSSRLMFCILILLIQFP